MGLDNQFKICRNCYEDEVEITSFGEESQFIKIRVCGRGYMLVDTNKCGFHDFCKGCSKRFICATERK